MSDVKSMSGVKMIGQVKPEGEVKQRCEVRMMVRLIGSYYHVGLRRKRKMKT